MSAQAGPGCLTSPMGKVRPVWILPVLLAAAGAALYFSEWVEDTQDIGFSEKALRNRYLAAERFLQSFGITVKLVDGLVVLDNLPPVD